MPVTIDGKSIDFQATALMVFTHNITGLKYFCKTTRLHQLESYKGSGKHWKRHLKVHGKDVTVGLLGIYWDKDRCMQAALSFSKENNIVESSEWANLIDENGLDGAPSGIYHPFYGKQSPCLGQKRPWVGKSGKDNPMFGKPSPMRGKKNIGASLAHKGRKRPEGGGKPSKAVIATDHLNNVLKFDSLANAGKFIGSDRHSIKKWCDMNKYSKGYVWEFAK